MNGQTCRCWLSQFKVWEQQNKHCKMHEHTCRRSYDYKVLTVSIYQIEGEKIELTTKIHIEEKSFD